MMLLGALPQSFQKELQGLKNILKNYTKRAYVVGGSVRDIFLKNPIKDLDIEVYDIQPQEFDTLMKSIGAKGVGKSFFVYKYESIDIALPRRERKVALGHKGFAVEVCQDEKSASLRRDFTMNSMMVNIFDDTLLDFWGGRVDIEDKTIRHIDIDAFQEDPLRVLRAVQFAARFNFSIADKTLHVMKDMALAELSHTRIFWELEKLFEAKNLEVGLQYMYELGLFEKVMGITVNLDELEKLSTALQNSQSFFEEHLRQYYFLYFLGNICKVDLQSLLIKIQAPKSYFKILLHAPYYEESLSDLDLVHIAIEMPLKDWLGLCKKGLKQKAIKLGLYEKAFDGGIRAAQVIADGFEGPQIAEEILRRKKQRAATLFENK